MSDNGFEGNASRIYPRIVQPAPGATSDRDKLCQIISEAVGGWNQNTQAITRVADAIHAAGFGLVADAGAKALEDAADAAFKDKGIQGLRRVLIGNWLRARAAAVRSTDAHD